MKMKSSFMTKNAEENKHQRKENTKTQTVYRESETQTQVWTPKVVIKSGDPEVLRLNDFKFGKNLPPGRHEVDTIERMRKRKSWDDYIASISNQENKDFRKQIISEIELNETMFRDKEFINENNARMKLVEKNINDFQDYMDQRNELRLKKLREKHEQERNKIYRKLHCQKTRMLRKIHKKQLGINMKYHKTDIFEEACDQTSDLYVNIARFGSNPRYRHENLVPEATKAILEIPPSKYPVKKPEKKIVVKKHDCHQKLTAIDDEFLATKPNLDIMNKPSMGKAPIPGVTSFRTRHEDSLGGVAERPFLEKAYQAAVLFQRLIRGRAIQALMQIGLERNRDLIDELKGTFGFSPSDNEDVNQQRYLKMSAFRDYHWLLRKFGLVAVTTRKLTGATISSIADFANKELMRIKDERRAYKIVQVAERDKWKREAAESGRRQKELRRRRQHDELYREVMRSNEITTDFYLKLLTESAISTVSKEQAYEKMVEYADKIDEDDKKQAMEDKTQVEREEVAALIIHSFLLPESEKEIIRKRISQHQEKARNFARRVIYGEIAGRNFDDKKETTLLEDLSGNIVYNDEDNYDESSSEIDEEDHECSEKSASTDIEIASEEEELKSLPPDANIEVHEKSLMDQISMDSVESLLKQIAQHDKQLKEDAALVTEEFVKDQSPESDISDPIECQLFPPITITLPRGETKQEITQIHPTKGYQRDLDEIKGPIIEDSSDSDISF